ncbi:CPXV218 protein [Cowpox virus]|uniref:CPXV218 protein n=1 Tax=Cowpox virus TaxID=10243 RepID=U5THS1_COWPX|nr:CPXV218 protein [Cowpox virus]AGY97575.1 CPXV218 protein [Cowpox virus]AGY98434.1 CPXV218 protein [Cowpox virus]AGY98650.1 CPXV218 protein [Cowpox virus]AGY99083.1 CPXV218 protein [Cowpox virus]
MTIYGLIACLIFVTSSIASPLYIPVIPPISEDKSFNSVEVLVSLFPDDQKDYTVTSQFNNYTIDTKDWIINVLSTPDGLDIPLTNITYWSRFTIGRALFKSESEDIFQKKMSILGVSIECKKPSTLLTFLTVRKMTRVFNRFPDMAYYRGDCLEAVYVTMTYKNTKTGETDYTYLSNGGLPEYYRLMSNGVDG